MKSMLTNRNSISGLAAILLLALCFVQPSVRAQELEPRWAAAAASGGGLPVDHLSMNYGKASLGYGQTLRLNFTYAVDPAQASQLPPAIRAMALFRDTSGNTIYVSGANGGVWKTRDSGQSWSFYADDPPITSGVCRQEKFALFEGPDIGDITGVDNGCTDVVAALKAAIDAGKKPVTSSAFFYLSELEPFLGKGYPKLPCFLKALKGTQFASATLVIDRSVTLSEPLILPSRFTLAGTGIDGTGSLIFTGLADGVAAIRFDNQATNITIRDISIGRLNGGVNVGIDVTRANKVFIRDALVTGFFAGVYGSRPGTTAFSVYIDRCSVFQNDYNIVMHRNAFHWRIRDCILNQAGCWGLRIFGPQGDPVPANGEPVYGNDHLVQGCRFEACGTGGALLGSDSAMLMNNRFEQNGGNGGVGIMIQSTASRTRLISNLFSGNSLINQGTQTQSFGTISDP